MSFQYLPTFPTVESLIWPHLFPPTVLCFNFGGWESFIYYYQLLSHLFQLLFKTLLLSSQFSVCTSLISDPSFNLSWDKLVTSRRGRWKRIDDGHRYSRRMRWSLVFIGVGWYLVIISFCCSVKHLFCFWWLPGPGLFMWFSSFSSIYWMLVTVIIHVGFAIISPPWWCCLAMISWYWIDTMRIVLWLFKCEG